MDRRYLIVLVLAVLAAGAYVFISSRPKQPDEGALLRERVTLLRSALTKFHDKRGTYPKEIRELVSAGVLKEIPPDPVTKSADTWRPIRQSEVRLDEFREVPVPHAATDDEIVDIRSGAPGYDRNGIAWSEY
ncbi:MAG TPA: hypothetical protein VIL97_04115 [Thermoanaerobaculia bacterium]